MDLKILFFLLGKGFFYLTLFFDLKLAVVIRSELGQRASVLNFSLYVYFFGLRLKQYNLAMQNRPFQINVNSVWNLMDVVRYS